MSIHPSILAAHAAMEAARAVSERTTFSSERAAAAVQAKWDAEKAFKAAVREFVPARDLKLIEAGQGTCCCCFDPSAEEVWFEFAQEEGA